MYVIIGISVVSPNGMVVTAYAHGIDKEITSSGVVIDTGTISDSGEMTGHPLMFYLSGEDIIVMEITFANGKSATKAISISLLDNGTFFATFDDYGITSQDDFVTRPDAAAIPRDILYGAPEVIK